MTPAQRCDAIIKMIDEVLEGSCPADPTSSSLLLRPGIADPRFAVSSTQDRP